MQKIVIHTDGSCWPNPGPGGWAYKIQFPEANVVDFWGRDFNTTNNRMELTAAIKAIERAEIWEDYQFSEYEFHVFTDSEYLQKGASRWLKSWRRKNFRGVKNDDLWRRLAWLSDRHHITWHWVRGHADCEANNYVDALAEAARKGEEI